MATLVRTCSRSFCLAFGCLLAVACGGSAEPRKDDEPSADNEAHYQIGNWGPSVWLFVVDDRADERGTELRERYWSDFSAAQSSPNTLCISPDPAALSPIDRRAILVHPSEQNELFSVPKTAPGLRLHSETSTSQGVADWVKNVRTTLDSRLAAEAAPYSPLEALASASDLLSGARAPATANEFMLVETAEGARVLNLVFVTGHDDAGTTDTGTLVSALKPLSDKYLLTAVDVILPARDSGPCREYEAFARGSSTRYLSWLDAAQNGIGASALAQTWAPGDVCELAWSGGGCAGEYCLPFTPPIAADGRADCELYIEPYQVLAGGCPNDIGWYEPEQTVSSLKPGACQVHQLTGTDLQNCRYSLACPDCPPGFCFSAVSQLTECSPRSAGGSTVALPRLIGGAGQGPLGRARLFCRK